MRAWPTAPTAGALGMGVDSADFNQDGVDGLVRDIDREMFAIYQNNHDDVDDQADRPGIRRSNLGWMSGWGLKFSTMTMTVISICFSPNGIR